MAEWPGILEQSAEENPSFELAAQKWPGTPTSPVPQIQAAPTQQPEWPGTPVTSQWPGTPITTPEAPQARDSFFDPGRDVVEFGKGFLSAGPGLVGSLPKAAALGARGFSRQQIKTMNDIDAGLTIREADDPIGYQHMTPEQRMGVRQEVQGTLATPVQDTGLFKAGGAIQNVFSEVTKPAPGVTPGLMRDVGGGVGSTVAGVGMGLIPGVGVPLAGGAFVAAGSAEAMDEAIKKGATQEQIERAGRLGGVAGSMDVVDALLPILGSAGKVAGLIKRIGVAAIKSAFIEGGQEGLQQLTQNVIAQGVYDPNRDLTQDVAYNALVGALSGGVVGGVIGGVERGPTPESPISQEAMIRGFSGEGPAPGGPTPPAPGGPTAGPTQLDLPLGPPTVEPELPLGIPPSGLPPAPAVPGVSQPSTLGEPAAVAPIPIPIDPTKTLRPDIGDFLNFGPDQAIKGSPLIAPNGPIDISRLLDERTEQRIKSAPGANTGRLARLLGPKLYGNPSEMAPITVKEILQNSFDAIKGMIQRGEPEGNIDIVTNPSDRTITVVDDGTGMTPEVLGRQFLEIAGTKKETERASGGLGIAKMMFLFGNKNLDVITMRNGKVSQLSTTGEELFAALDNPKKAPDINVREPTPQDLEMFPKGRGTVIKVQIPENYKDTSTGEMRPIYFSSEVGSARDIPVLRNSPLFDNINVTFNGEQVPIGKNFPHDEYTPFVGDVKFDWGTASIYVSQQEHTYDKYGGSNAHVLSNGLFQFSINLNKKPGETYGDKIQRTFYIDVSPKVSPEHAGYPFDLNRQQFAKQAQEDFKKIFNFVSKTYQLEEFQLEVENFGEMQYVQWNALERGVKHTPPFTLKPPKPQTTPVRGIKSGDKVSVKNGKIVVNGRSIPEMTPKEIEEFKVDTKSLKIPQSQINSNEVILHDNTAVDPTGAPLTATAPRVSLTQYAVQKFGNRFYEYSFLMGNAMRQLRDVVATVTDSLNRPYTELKQQAIGISYDKSYRGVSIRVPFSGSFLNPAVPAFPNDPIHAAVGMVTTMVHEFAHLHHRSEEGLGPVIQDLFTKLDTHPTFDFQAYKQKVINIVNTYFDVMTNLNGVYQDGNVESRGIRFKTGTDQARDGSSSGNIEPGSLGQGSKGSNLSEWVKLSETGSGQLAGRDSGSARIEEVGGATAADFGISANQRALDRETGEGVPAAARSPETQIVYQAVTRAVGVGSNQSHAIAASAAHADRINWFYNWMAGILELAKVNPAFTPLLTYVQKLQLMHRDESTIQDKGVSFNKEWRRLGRQSENLAAFLDDITNMRYLTPQEKAQGITRNPSRAEITQYIRQHGMEPKTVAFAERVRAFFSDFLDLVSTNAVNDAVRLISDPVARAQRIHEIQAQVATLKSRPYFPFMRYGKYFVTVRDANGKVLDFQMFERRGLVTAQRRQQSFKKEMVSRYGKDRVQDGVLPENTMPMVGMPRILLDQMKTKLNLTKLQVDALEQLTYEMSPSLSFKHRFQHKNYTPGYSKDFARSFARYVFYGARFYARTKYVQGLRDDIAAAGQVGGNKADRIRNYMQDHLDNTILDAKGDFGWLKGLAFMWHLGYSPAAAFTNMTQTPIFTFPYLADKFGAPGIGDAKAIGAMLKAIVQVNKTFRRKGHYQGLSDFEMRALGYGIKTGVVSETQAAELAALGNSTNLLYGSAGNVAERGMMAFQQGGALMFELTEQTNRRIAFRAALNLAMSNPTAPIITEAVNRRPDEFNTLVNVEGYTPEQARGIIAALHTVEETQVVYGRYARPRFLRSRLAGTVLIFERYTQAMIMQMWHNKGAAVRSILLMGLLGGLGGLPGYEDIMGVIKAVYRRMGFGANPEDELRKWILQQFDGTVEPDIILHGLARRGFGIPWILDALGSTWTGQPGRGLEGAKPGQNAPVPVLDFSKNVGMGQILPVQIGKLMDPVEDINKSFSEQAQRASGAGFSIFFNMLRTISDHKTPWTDQKRWEKAVPREAGALSKAYRAYEEGRERTRTGGGPQSASTLINYDVRDTEQLLEVIAKGLGYNVFRESTKWDLVIAKKEAEAFTKMERTALVEQFFEAWSGQESKEIDEVRKAIGKFNEEVRGTEFRGYAITSESLKSSVESRQRERIGQETGVPTQKRQVPLMRAIQELYPEAKGLIDVRKVQ